MVLAGKPIVFEPFPFSILYSEGQLDASPLVQRICDGDVDLPVLNYPIEDAPLRVGQGYATWPAPGLNALRDKMELGHQNSGSFLYISRVFKSYGDSAVNLEPHSLWILARSS